MSQQLCEVCLDGGKCTRSTAVLRIVCFGGSIDVSVCPLHESFRNRFPSWKGFFDEMDRIARRRESKGLIIVKD